MPDLALSPTGRKAITNARFLETIFGPAWPRAHVATLAGDPNSPADRSVWAGRAAGRAGAALENGALNQYWTVSLFRPDPATGRAVRRISTFESYHAVLFDDVGPKVDPAGVLTRIGAPTWRLETSPGNEQWGYLLDTPERDVGRANALCAELVKAGVSSTGKDPGMVGVTRYGRMPVGTNGKAALGAAGFAGVLREWEPRRTFTLDEVATAWGIVLPPPGSVVATTPRAPLVPGQGAGDAWLDAMSELGHVQGMAGSGWGYLVTCPCLDEHTDRADTGSAYVPGARPGVAGAWKCYHGHCVDRPQHEFVAALDGRLEAAGLEPFRRREFGDVAEQVGPGAVLPSVVDAFLAEYVYLRPEDAFYSTRSRQVEKLASVNRTHAARLRAACTVLVPGKGEDADPVEKVLPVATWYLGQDRARLVDEQTYWPGRPVVFGDGFSDYVNRYRAPEFADTGRVRSGDVAPWLDLVWHVCGHEGRRAVRALLDWAAAVAGAPEFKPAWMVAVVGAQGIGKDLMMNPLQVAAGRENCARIEGDVLMGSFNDYAVNRYVHVAELRQTSRGSSSGHDQYNRLKALVDPTQRFLTINPKYARPYQARNVCAVYTSSNDENAIALESDDRRAFVFVSPAARLGAEYYRTVGEWLAGGGSARVALWLRQRWARMPESRCAALSGPAPATTGKAAMTLASVGALGDWLVERIEDGTTDAWPDLMTAAQVMEQVHVAAESGRMGLPRGTRVPNAHAMAKLLPKVGAVLGAGGMQVRLPEGRRRVWIMRDRAKYEALGGVALAKIIEDGVKFNGSEIKGFKDFR